MQEAYRPPCSDYSFCCPNWVPPWQGTPAGPGRVPPPCDRQMEGQTHVKTLPSRRTTYAGGKYVIMHSKELMTENVLSMYYLCIIYLG